MKKTIIFILWAVLIMTDSIANAQEQKTDIIHRRHYENKERIYTEWYNNISIRGAVGIRNIGTTWNEYVPPTSSVENHILLGNDTSFIKTAVLSISYERLKRENHIYYGPGIAINVSTGESTYKSADIYLRGRYELDINTPFLGYDISGLHPYASAAIGLTYFLTYSKELGKPEIRIDYYKITNSDGYLDSYSHYRSGFDYSALTGIKFYLDYGLGFAIDCGKHKALILGYRAMLYPCVSSNLDLREHTDEIDALVQRCYSNKENGSTTVYGESKQVMRFFHGAEVSFRF